MSSNKKTKWALVLLGGVLLLSVLLSGPRRGCDAWVVFVSALPNNFSAKGAVDMESSYMLRQTHEAMFRKDDGQNFQSRVLKKWTRSPDFRNYTFCQDNTLVFYGEHKFSNSFFQAYISSVTGRYSPDFKQTWEDGCITVTFAKSAKEYLNFLSKYENAPSLQMSPTAEAGLGPFMVAEMTNAMVRLQRKKYCEDGYNSVVLRQYKPGDDISGVMPVSDFNKVLFDKKWDTTNYFAFDNVEPRSIVLLINYPDRSVRAAVYNCLDIGEFNRAYVSTLGSFNYVGTVLPMGMVGAQFGRPSQNCQAVRRRFSGQELVLANFQPGNDVTLRKFLDAFNDNTGLSIKARRYSSKELVDIIKEKRERQPYELIVLMVDSTRNEYADIFDNFYGENNIIADIPAKQKRLFMELVREEDPGKKEKIAHALSTFLADEYFALPLFQYSKTMYYPKDIKNIIVGRSFIEYPEVADFRR